MKIFVDTASMYLTVKRRHPGHRLEYRKLSEGYVGHTVTACVNFNDTKSVKFGSFLEALGWNVQYLERVGNQQYVDWSVKFTTLVLTTMEACDTEITLVTTDIRYLPLVQYLSQRCTVHIHGMGVPTVYRAVATVKELDENYIMPESNHSGQ